MEVARDPPKRQTDNEGRAEIQRSLRPHWRDKTPP
jgi:hypothetical protein